MWVFWLEVKLFKYLLILQSEQKKGLNYICDICTVSIIDFLFPSTTFALSIDGSAEKLGMVMVVRFCTAFALKSCTVRR